MEIYPSNVKSLVQLLPTTQSVLIRGHHGIGKSQVAASLGDLLNLEVIDLRLSQMTEGDFLGLPKITGDDDAMCTSFAPMWWFVKACNEPVILFLDEMNRAVQEVMQCAFQLVLDRAIQGMKVHPDTRIISAVNGSHHYNVNEIDPALLDRFLVIDMIPSITEWCAWAAQNDIDSRVIEFCAQHVDHWWFNPSANQALEPGKVYPTPRAWAMLSTAMTNGGLIDKNVGATETDTVFAALACGLVGTEAGLAFVEFIRTYLRNITAEDVLERFEKLPITVIKNLSAEQVLTLGDKIIAHAQTTTWSDYQAINLRKFFEALENGELTFSIFTKFQASLTPALGNEAGDPGDRAKKMIAANNSVVRANFMLAHRHTRDVISRVMITGKSR